MRYFLFLFLLLASPLFAANIDDQIAAANKSADSLRVVAHKLGSQKVAARLDSLAQADATLKVAGVKIVAGDKDSVWVKIALDKLSALDLKIVRAELKGAELSWQETSSPDTLYIRRDRAEKALPVISAALKE